MPPLRSGPTPSRRSGRARDAGCSCRGISFERADAERTIARWRVGRSEFASGWWVGRHRVEKTRGRREEEVAGDSPAEIEQPVVIARRPADKHVFEHLFDGARRTAVADEIGAELALSGLAEGHIVA